MADIRTTVQTLKAAGVALADLEREITCRNKWGKMQNADLMAYTTADLQEIFENWVKF